MYVVEEMRINKFVDAEIPSPKKLFEQYGYNHQVHRGDVGDDGAFAAPCNLGSDDTRIDSLARTGATMFEAMQDARIAAAQSSRVAIQPSSTPSSTEGVSSD